MDNERFGSTTAFAEPYWYNEGNDSPYYNEHHKAYRAKIRKFVDEEITPFVDEWEKVGEIPAPVYRRAAEVGLLAATVGWPESIAGKRPQGYDGFFSLIAYDELCRCASGGVVWGLTGGLGIGLPPVLYYGSEEMQERVCKPCMRGEKRIALAVSEATAGSDVANLKTTAVEDGKGNYIVNGLKKWITVGLFADFYTVAVRTGETGSGMGGISLLLIERARKGVSVRAMDCMGCKASGTAYVEFDDVVVPMNNLIGDVTCLLRNFITERMGIAVQANRFARQCLSMTVEYAKRRRAFGKKLEDQPVVRQKIANMARSVISTHHFLESLVYRMSQMEKNGDAENWFDGILKLGSEAALLKVQATRTFELCAREAAHTHGGNAYVKGNRVESLYRHVLSLAIPGGSEDVMIDAAARLALKGRL